MPENNNNDNEIRRRIDCEYKNMRTRLDENENGKLCNSFIIASMCEKCDYIELAPEMKKLGMDKVNWKLVADTRGTFKTRSQRRHERSG